MVEARHRAGRSNHMMPRVPLPVRTLIYEVVVSISLQLKNTWKIYSTLDDKAHWLKAVLVFHGECMDGKNTPACSQRAQSLPSGAPTKPPTSQPTKGKPASPSPTILKWIAAMTTNRRYCPPARARRNTCGRAKLVRVRTNGRSLGRSLENPHDRLLNSHQGVRYHAPPPAANHCTSRIVWQ